MQKFRKVVILLITLILLSLLGYYSYLQLFSKKEKSLTLSNTGSYSTFYIPDVKAAAVIEVPIPSISTLQETDYLTYWKYDTIEVYLNPQSTLDLDRVGASVFSLSDNVQVMVVSSDKDAMTLIQNIKHSFKYQVRFNSDECLEQVPEIKLENETLVKGYPLTMRCSLDDAIMRYHVAVGQLHKPVCWYKDDVQFYADRHGEAYPYLQALFADLCGKQTECDLL